MKRLALLFVTSCALTRPLTASNDDLADHRAFVLARTEGDRLARATRYLEKHPNGAWSKDVRATFDAEEPGYYRASTKSRTAAIDYIAWLPRGPHADAAFALVRSEDEHEPEDEQSRMLKAARENEARLERAAEERAAAHDAALSTLHAVVADVYGKPLEAAPDLTQLLLGGMNFGATPSHRTRILHFEIPSRAGPIARTLQIDIDVVRDASGRVTSSTVTGPELFQRIAETVLLREVLPDEGDRYVRDAVTTLARGLDLRIDFAANSVRISAK